MSNTNKNIFLIPGTYIETSRRDAPGVDVRSLIRSELRSNGYPTNNCYDKSCVQPVICDLLTDCSTGGGGGDLCAINGLTLFEDPACIGLGGSLELNTTIDVDSNDFEIINDVVKLEFSQIALPFGGGPSVRLYGTDGVTTAEMGVYQSGGGVPSIGQRTYNSGSDVYTWINHDTALSNLTIRSGAASESGYFTVTMDENEVIIGRADTNSVILKVERRSFDDGSFVMSLEGLPTYIDNADAIAAGLSTNDLYKVDAGGATVVGIVV